MSTPTGVAVIQTIHRQDYAAGPHSNPYVIPAGQFGATQKLYISPRHRVAVDGRMIEARDLNLQQEDIGALTYYNLGLPQWANMIVAGVTVESMAPLSSVVISREKFDHILATQYGGKMNDNMKAKCIFLPDGSVSVPTKPRA